MREFTEPSVPLLRRTIVLGLLLASVGPSSGQDAEVTRARGPIQPLRVALHPAVELDRLTPLLHGEASFARLKRAANLSLDLAVLSGSDPAERVRLLREAEGYARQALAHRPDDLDARFLIGAAIGLRVQHMETRQKMRMAEEIRGIVAGILERDPSHAGGLHLQGRLHAAAMRLSAIERFLGRTLLGADLLGEASWKEAEQSFREALRSEPDNPAHRWELAQVLADTDREDEARSELERILALDGRSALLAHFRDRARAELKRRSP